MASVTRDRPKGSRPPPSVRTRLVHLGNELVTSIVAIGTLKRCRRNRKSSKEEMSHQSDYLWTSPQQGRKRDARAKFIPLNA